MERVMFYKLGIDSTFLESKRLMVVPAIAV